MHPEEPAGPPRRRHASARRGPGARWPLAAGGAAVLGLGALLLTGGSGGSGTPRPPADHEPVGGPPALIRTEPSLTATAPGPATTPARTPAPPPPATTAPAARTPAPPTAATPPPADAPTAGPAPARTGKPGRGRGNGKGPR
ncbi:hypothetical protein [Streptomyces termitum]|uniref:hypothetical protein n=1 Tax=Streptomyces termitum TaxID=67368 RepID=UPI0037B74D62